MSDRHATLLGILAACVWVPACVYVIRKAWQDAKASDEFQALITKANRTGDDE